jgi:hypothetical protein
MRHEAIIECLYCRNLRLSQGVSWLICVPSAIYRAIIRRCATWWMKRLSKLRWNGTSVPEEKAAYFGLLKHLFAVLDHEVANSRQFGEFVSLDAPVEADAQDVAEAMVRGSLRILSAR